MFHSWKKSQHPGNWLPAIRGQNDVNFSKPTKNKRKNSTPNGYFISWMPLLLKSCPGMIYAYMPSTSESECLCPRQEIKGLYGVLDCAELDFHNPLKLRPIKCKCRFPTMIRELRTLSSGHDIYRVDWTQVAGILAEMIIQGERAGKNN